MIKNNTPRAHRTHRPLAASLAAVAGSLTLLVVSPAPAAAQDAKPAVARAASAAAVAAAPDRQAGHRPLDRVTSLLAERLLVADKVAAAKYGTSLPIEDVVRERQILDDVARRSAALGLDPVRTSAVFRDQIEAGKNVQRALFARWDAHPEERPTERPDLGRDVRPVLDRITTDLLAALTASGPARAAASCRFAVAVSAAGQVHVRDLDRVHAVNLFRGLRNVCTG
ncbi:gamma subclass chorismate mutase AroQ [Streptomyces sp. NPDC059578]|uniref:gamma subclass chorismate mutase AroQ n=1 Tax=unclassified Streptomyces TaxID=2593676 RepID=UPI0036650FD6